MRKRITIDGKRYRLLREEGDLGAARPAMKGFYVPVGSGRIPKDLHAENFVTLLAQGDPPPE